METKTLTVTGSPMLLTSLSEIAALYQLLEKGGCPGVVVSITPLRNEGQQGPSMGMGDMVFFESYSPQAKANAPAMAKNIAYTAARAVNSAVTLCRYLLGNLAKSSMPEVASTMAADKIPEIINYAVGAAMRSDMSQLVAARSSPTDMAAAAASLQRDYTDTLAKFAKRDDRPVNNSGIEDRDTKGGGWL